MNYSFIFDTYGFVSLITHLYIYMPYPVSLARLQYPWVVNFLSHSLHSMLYMMGTQSLCNTSFQKIDQGYDPFMR